MVNLEINLSRMGLEKQLHWLIVWYLFFGVFSYVADMFSNFFLFGNDIITVFLTLGMWFTYILAIYTMIILFFYVIGIFSNVGRE